LDIVDGGRGRVPGIQTGLCGWIGLLRGESFMLVMVMVVMVVMVRIRTVVLCARNVTRNNINIDDEANREEYRGQD
jgi:hypothetical protein